MHSDNNSYSSERGVAHEREGMVEDGGRGVGEQEMAGDGLEFDIDKGMPVHVRREIVSFSSASPSGGPSGGSVVAGEEGATEVGEPLGQGVTPDRPHADVE
jgi:hypothetical protein